ncbi:Similar to conserved hypothetical protein [Penicillium marneffei ATCC 18224]; acc. no. XP_002144529 [Pyronema omphalodes CBS 100304]|uniref:HTH CENPB-type domain-containing protein n=1 Tax=Pyronema omphalodes (strain CBS 100304) TaxID=1076935 RepID=U4LXF7_PYROM|nr:Similar to conserved hypothetical protein [Penicillium marneffei ATCC 18224]; acc. no. XP_002144529 [Pyronema omphalodes CBS 100304]
MQPSSEAHKDQQQLSDEEEKAIVRFCQHVDDLGHPLNLGTLKAFAIAIQPPSKCREVRKHWITWFPDRHPELEFRCSQCLDRQRANANDPVLIKDYFQKLRKLIRGHSLHPENIYNMDEKGFLLGQAPKVKVMCRRARKNPKFTQDGNSEMEKDAIFMFSPKGWTDNKLRLEYIQHFDRQTKAINEIDEWLRRGGNIDKKGQFYDHLIATMLCQCARETALTPTNICKAFETTGIWPFNPTREDLGRSTPNTHAYQGCQQVVEIIDGHGEGRFCSCTANNGLIDQLGRVVIGALVEKEIYAKDASDLRVSKKDVSVKAVKNHRHLSKASVMTEADVQCLGDEKLQQELEKADTDKKCLARTSVTTAKGKTTINATKQIGKQVTWVDQALSIVEDDWIKNAQDITTYMEEEGADSGHEEDPFIDIDDVLGSRGIISCGNMAEYEGKRVEVVTRSGRRAQSVSYTK